MLGRRSSLDTATAERDATPARRMLTFERNLLQQIERLRDQLRESERELRLSPENIRSVVEIGLQIANQPPLILADVPGLPGEAFRLPHLSGSWARSAEGLAHPHTGEIRPIVFDYDLADGRDDIVLAHLNHRLVQMCLRLLREEVWSSEGQRRLNRVTARLVPDEALHEPAVVAHGRLVVLGADNHRLHEELISAGGYLREGRFARFGTLTEMQGALDAALPEEAPEVVQERLQRLWPSHKEALLRSLEVRMRDRTANLGNWLKERAD